MNQWLSFQFIFLGKKAYVSDNLDLKPIAGLEFAALVEVTAKIILKFSCMHNTAVTSLQ